MSKTHIPKVLYDRVASQAGLRCGYCLSAQAIAGQKMEIDHFIPEALGGKTEEENLWLACRDCNGFKGERVAALDPESGEIVPLFNPRQQRWRDHFAWNEAGDKMVGLTAIGRATVIALKLNRRVLVQARQLWVAAGWHPPKDQADAV